MISAKFTIDGYNIGSNYIVSQPGGIVNLQLLDVSGIKKIEWNIVSIFPSETITPIITKGGNPSGSFASFTFPNIIPEFSGKGICVLIQCIINNGRNENNTINSNYTAYGSVGSLNAAGKIPFVLGETSQFGAFSIINRLNDTLRFASDNVPAPVGLAGDLVVINSSGLLENTHDNLTFTNDTLNISGNIIANDGYFTNISVSGKVRSSIDMNSHSILNITTIGSSYLTTTAREATFNFGSNDIIVGDGYIKAQTSLSNYIGVTRELELNNTALYPYTNIGLDLGTSSFRFNNVYGTILNIDGSGTFSGTLSGITTIGSSYLTTTPNDATFNFGSNDVVIGDGYIKASGASLATYIGGLSKLTLNATEFYPTTDSNISLGITGNRWSNFFSDNATIVTLIMEGSITGATTISANNIIVDNSTVGNAVLSLKANSLNYSYIDFGDESDVDIGRILYRHSSDQMEFSANNSRRLILSSTELYPYTDSQISLGITANRWSNFFSDDATIAIANINTLTINTSIIPDTDGGANIGAAINRISQVYAQQLNLSNNTGNCYLQIQSSDTGAAVINFGDGYDTNIGQIYYNNVTESFIFTVNNATELTLSSSELRPVTNNGLNLGASSYRFDTIYGTSLNLNGDISGATTISSSYFTTTANDVTFNFGSNDVVIGDGYIKASGAALATYIGTSSKLTLTATQFYPTTDSQISLGITANRWSNFFSDDATISIANINTLTINTSIIPDTDNGATLGAVDNRFNTIYLNTFSVKDVNVNSNTTTYITSDDGYFSLLYLGYTGNTDNNGLQSFNSSTAGESFIRFRVDDASTMVLYDSYLRPYSNNLLDLGKSSYRWDVIYGTSLNLNGAISGITTIGSSYLTTTSNNAIFSFGSNNISIGDGYIKASGASLATYIGGLSKLTLNATQFYPTVDSQISLGITGNRWSNFFSDSVTITNGNIDTIYTNLINLNGAISGATTISSTYFTTTTNDVTFNFGSNDIIIGDGYIKAQTSLTTYIGVTRELELNNIALYPYTNIGLDLGTSNYRWGTTYNDGIIDGYQLTENTSSYLRLKTKNGQYSYVDFASGSKGTSGQIAYDHTNDYLRFYINKTINMGIDVSSIYPYTNELINLGKSSNYFKDGYISNLFCSNIKASGATLQSYIGASSKLTLNATQFYPTVDSQISLGITGNRWSNFFSDSATITNGNIDTIYTNSINLNGAISGATTISSTYFTTTPNDVTFNFGSNDVVIGDGYIKIPNYIYFNNLGKINYNYTYDTLSFGVDETFELGLSSTALYPYSNRGLNLGVSGTGQWDNIYAYNTTVSTSDEREKQDILPIDGYVLDAWGDISLVFYRWISSVQEKGENARIHSGIIAQSIKKAFYDHGLDANRYGLFCYDEWEEKTIDGIIIPAGNQYSIRATECLFVEAAYQRRENYKIKERLNKLENLLGV